MQGKEERENSSSRNEVDKHPGERVKELTAATFWQKVKGCVSVRCSIMELDSKKGKGNGTARGEGRKV